MGSPFALTAPELVWTCDRAFDAVGGTAPVESAGARHLAGIGSRRLDSVGTAVGSNSWGEWDFSPALDFSAGDRITFRIFFENGEAGQTASAGTGIRVLLGTGPGLTNYYWTSGANDYAFKTASRFREQCVMLTILKSDFTPSGSPNWASIAKIRVYVNNQWTTAVADVHRDYYGSATFDAVYAGGNAQNIVRLSCDDSDASQSIAFGDLDSEGWKATQFVTPGYLGLANKLTEAQATAYHDNGHRFCQHTYDHDLLSSADYLEAHNWLLAKGNWLPFGAYTSGEYNQALIDYLKSLGYLGFRGAETPLPHFARGQSAMFDFQSEYPAPFEQMVVNLSSTSTIAATGAAALGLLDAANARGYALSFYWHKIVTTPAGEPDPARCFATAEWQVFFAGLQSRAASGLRVMAEHEYMQAMIQAGSGGHVIGLGFRNFSGRRFGRG